MKLDILIEIEEVAQIDAASGQQILTEIVLMLARPASIVTAVMVLIFVWNEHLFATTFMMNEVVIHWQNFINYNQMIIATTGHFFSSAILVSIPILIVFFCIQKYMVSGLTAEVLKDDFYESSSVVIQRDKQILFTCIIEFSPASVQVARQEP